MARGAGRGAGRCGGGGMVGLWLWSTVWRERRMAMLPNRAEAEEEVADDERLWVRDDVGLLSRLL